MKTKIKTHEIVRGDLRYIINDTAKTVTCLFTHKDWDKPFIGISKLNPGDAAKGIPADVYNEENGMRRAKLRAHIAFHEYVGTRQGNSAKRYDELFNKYNDSAMSHFDKAAGLIAIVYDLDHQETEVSE